MKLFAFSKETNPNTSPSGFDYAQPLGKILPDKFKRNSEKYARKIDKTIYTREQLVDRQKNQVILNEGHVYELLNYENVHDLINPKLFIFVDTGNEKVEVWMAIPTSIITKLLTKKPELIAPIMKVLYHQFKTHVGKAYPIRNMLDVPEFKTMYEIGKRDAQFLKTIIESILQQESRISKRNRKKSAVVANGFNANREVLSESLEKFEQVKQTK